jgi:hypothetical protein
MWTTRRTRGRNVCCPGGECFAGASHALLSVRRLLSPRDVREVPTPPPRAICLQRGQLHCCELLALALLFSRERVRQRADLRPGTMSSTNRSTREVTVKAAFHIIGTTSWGHSRPARPSTSGRRNPLQRLSVIRLYRQAIISKPSGPASAQSPRGAFAFLRWHHCPMRRNVIVRRQPVRPCERAAAPAAAPVPPAAAPPHSARHLPRRQSGRLPPALEQPFL